MPEAPAMIARQRDTTPGRGFRRRARRVGAAVVAPAGTPAGTPRLVESALPDITAIA